MSRFQRAARTVVRSIRILMAGLLTGALEKLQSWERLQLAVRGQRQPRRRQHEEQNMTQETHWRDRYKFTSVCSNKKAQALGYALWLR